MPTSGRRVPVLPTVATAQPRYRLFIATSGVQATAPLVLHRWPPTPYPQAMEAVVGEGEHVQVIHPGAGCIAGRAQVRVNASLLWGEAGRRTALWHFLRPQLCRPAYS